MKIINDFLTVNEWSRPGKNLKEVLAIILHWTGNPNSTAKQNRDYFESRKNGKLGYGSAQYIIGLDGEIILCIPEKEVAYHCGSSKEDPTSGKIYTDWARNIFGEYASTNNSPNNASIGIELCVIDDKGNYTDKTIESAISLVVDIKRRYQIPIDNIGTHNLVVGWKDCPRLWTANPVLFNLFKLEVEKNYKSMKV